MTAKAPSYDAQIHGAVAAAQHYPCLLCGNRKIHRTGVYWPSPEHAQLFEDPTRLYGYAVCKDCFELDDIEEQVDAKLVETWGRKDIGPAQ